MQRRHTIAIGHFGIRAGLQQQVDAVEIVSLHGPVQRCASIGKRSIDVGLLVDERANGGAIFAPGCLGQPGVGLRGRSQGTERHKARRDDHEVRRDIEGLRVPEKPSRFGRSCARPATSKLLQIDSPTASSAQVLPPAGTLTPANQRVALAASNFHSLALEGAFLTRNARASAVAKARLASSGSPLASASCCRKHLEGQANNVCQIGVQIPRPSARCSATSRSSARSDEDFESLSAVSLTF